MENDTKLMCLIVTYNRLKLLKKTLTTYDNQSVKPKEILIVNNNSNDGTAEFLNVWKNIESGYKKNIINLKKNIGGSGGFYEGMKFFMQSECNWLFLHDDDAYLEKETLENLYKHIEENKSNKVAAICGEIIDKNEINVYHRRNIVEGILKVRDIKIDKQSYNKNKFKINVFSFVGVAINKQILKEAGLVNRDFFIHFDDTEHSYRISKYGEIFVYPDIKVHHDTKISTNNNADWRLYYDIRNKLYFYKKNFRKIIYRREYLHWKLVALKKKIKKDIKNEKIVEDALEDCKNDKLGINTKYIPNK